MSLKDKNVVVTGGSRGLGLGLVEALVAHGARVTVVARGADALESVRARLGVATISADVTDETAAQRILADVRPEILVLNAGATPRMERLDQISWRTSRPRGRPTSRPGSIGCKRRSTCRSSREAASGGIERRGRERLAALGRLRRRQAHAPVHGEVREWDRQAERAGHPLPGNLANADYRRDPRPRRGRQRLTRVERP